MNEMIRHNGLPADIAVLARFTADAELKVHPAYRAAKAGDADAALELVLDFAASWLGQYRHRFPEKMIYVAPHALEASGENAIPQTLAQVCAELFDGQVDTEVVQSDRVYHTGADAMERMATRAQFEGLVVSGANYVLVDDVTNLGGTLAELNHYIQCYGGVVKDVVVLVNAGRSTALAPTPKDVRLITERFGHDFTDIFGIEPAALTANEARYLVGFRSIDEIRNRLAAARQEIHRRLRSKGITRAFESTELGASAKQALSAPTADQKKLDH